MGMCNYCTLASLKRQVKKENKRIILKQSSFLGGVEVFAVAKGERLPEYKDWGGGFSDDRGRDVLPKQIIR